MEDTEAYLNSILQKRANAVPNPYSTKSRTTKQHDNLTRIPVILQQPNDMPTIFRKKGDTVLQNGSTMESRTQYTVSSDNWKMFNGMSNYNDRQTPIQSKQAENFTNQGERVEYMMITKRIQMRECEEESGGWGFGEQGQQNYSKQQEEIRINQMPYQHPSSITANPSLQQKSSYESNYSKVSTGSKHRRKIFQ